MQIQPKNFSLEKTTIWSFPNRGNWATHSGQYHGNWSPYIPRNLILRYSKPGDWILDQFVGSGTTLIESKLLNRNAIGIDINPNAVNLTKTNLDFLYESNSRIYVFNGNAMDISKIKNQKIDFICTHPPYADIIRYSDNLKGDISCLTIEKFLEALSFVTKESYRVLKKNHYCSVMMGDVRKHGKVIPLGFMTMKKFLSCGFTLQEIIIKEQHNCKSTSYWEKQNSPFFLLAHEYIFVFKK